MTDTHMLRHGLWALLAIAAVGLSLAGCASDAHREDEEQARRWKKEALGARLIAGAIAGELALEAGRLEDARKQEKEPQAAASFQRLSLGRVVLEAIEDAENALVLATRYHEVRSDLDLPPRWKARLDQDVARMTEVAAAILGKRVPIFAPAPGRPCDPMVALALQKDLERDRAALRAFRVDIGLITQLGGASAGE